MEKNFENMNPKERGRNAAGEITVIGECKGRRQAKRLSALFDAIRKTYLSVSEWAADGGWLPGEMEWLCDNLYIAEGAAKRAARAFSETKTLEVAEGSSSAGSNAGADIGIETGAEETPYIVALAARVFSPASSPQLDSDCLEKFLSGALEIHPIKERELWLFPDALAYAELIKLYALSDEIDRELAEYRGEEGIFAAEAESRRLRSEGMRATPELESSEYKARQAHAERTARAAEIFAVLRFLESSRLDKLLRALSPVERIYQSDPSGIYPRLDEESRDRCRAETARLAKKHAIQETDAAQRILALCEQAVDERERDIAYHLFEEPLKQKKREEGRIYFAMLFLLTAALFLSLYALAGPVAALLLLIPLFIIVKGICDSAALKRVPPSRLLRLALKDGIPADGRTLCVITALLSRPEEAVKLAENLKYYSISNRDAGGELLFGLLADLPDADTEKTDMDDDTLRSATEAINSLNACSGGGFYLFTRKRVQCEGRWSGWERKRGSLINLCELLLGRQSAITAAAGDTERLRDVRFLVTLDADTVPAIGSIKELVSIMLCPINRPRIDERLNIVTTGHAVIQPRMTTQLDAASRSPFSRTYAGLGGCDPYGGVSSDLYQDLFGQGSYAGKGIIDIAAYDKCVSRRFPDNRILSHDLLEGCYLRAAYAGDIEFFDGFPYKTLSYFARLHRWTRGDWQLLGWLCKKAPGPSGRIYNPLGALCKWKMADNLIRSLSPALLLAALFYAAVFNNVWAGAAAIAAAAFPVATEAAAVLLRGRGLGVKIRSKASTGLIAALKKVVAEIVFLPYTAYISVTAAAVTLWRLFVTHRGLLLWTTAAQTDSRSGGATTHYQKMWFSALCGAAGLLLGFSPLTTVFSLCWLFSPMVAERLSKPDPEKKLPLTDAAFLRERAEVSWKYFATLLNEENNYLPPDNYQESPPAGVAARTSPTNIGLSLLSCLAALDMSLCDAHTAINLIGKTLDSCGKMKKWHGHLLNWYDIRTLRPLSPESVSAVDSGNFAGALIALAAGLKDIPGGEKLAERCTALAEAMDFRPLYDAERRLFHISYDITNDKLTSGCYDLLASEAQLMSYICVARGEVPRKHWRALGRSLISYRGWSGMLSWTGTAFEYFMPILLLPVFESSALYESLLFSVFCQRVYAKKKGLPCWGLSESAFYAFDPSLVYRYKAHGVPLLGLKRGLGKDLVVSPYSSFLSLDTVRSASIRNIRQLMKLGAEGELGMYEALDFTPSRRVSSKSFELVRTFMAHHLGMSIVACDNAINGGIMRQRFLTDPRMRAYTELLQEKIPVGALHLRPSAVETPEAASVGRGDGWRREYTGADPYIPRCLLLSNGSYSLLLTDGGYSASVSGGMSLTRSDGGPFGGLSGISFFFYSGGKLLPLQPAPFYQDLDYSSVFDGSGAELRCKQKGFESALTVRVSDRDKAELRGVRLRSAENCFGELICYFEPVMQRERDYLSHPAFSKLFIDTRIVSRGALLRRKDREGRHDFYMAFLCSENGLSCDTSRESALGRGGFDRIGSHSFEKQSDRRQGTVVDPCVMVRLPLHMEAGKEYRIRFALATGESGTKALTAAERTLNLPAFRSAQPVSEAAARLAMSGADIDAAFELLSALRFPPPGSKGGGTKGVEPLWKHGVSGDYPVAVFEADDSGALLPKIIRRHRFLSLCGFHFDLLLVCSDVSDYLRPARSAVIEAMKAAGAESALGRRGGVHIADAASQEDRQTLLSSGYLISRENISLESLRNPSRKLSEAADIISSESPMRFTLEPATFIAEDNGKAAPVAWTNTLAGTLLGAIVSDAGPVCEWYLNAREGMLDYWENDPLYLGKRPKLEIIYKSISYSPFSAGDGLLCTITHKPGITFWKKQLPFGMVETTAFISRMPEARILLIEYSGDDEVYCRYTDPLLLGGSTGVRRYVDVSATENGLVAKSASSPIYANKSAAYLSFPPPLRSTGSLHDAAENKLSGVFGNLAEPCVCIETAPVHGRAVFLAGVVHAGVVDDHTELDALSNLTAWENAVSARDETAAYWEGLVSPIRIKTPNAVMDNYINSWALYQTIACRMLARSSIYQCGGAYGFRDQLQDCCAAMYADPSLARAQILRAAAHQYQEGDAQHWWHPCANPSDEKGIRTRYTDDLLWLVYALCEYVSKTGDLDFCGETAPYLSSPPLAADESERYEPSRPTGGSGSLYEHCVRAAERFLSRGNGVHGLPLIGGGDWNDGMNLVGDKDGGESVWLAEFAAHTLERFSELCAKYGDGAAAEKYLKESNRLKEAVESVFNGDWFPRGYYSDGSELGGRDAEECRIDSISQAFAALAGCSPKLCDSALKSACDQLVDSRRRVVSLLTPPFSEEGSQKNPGYIKSYPPGIRENGGQYTHGAIWLALGLLLRGMTDEGYTLLDFLLPATHDASVYRTEPYVLPADVYTAVGQEGRGGWSWYTGAAGWYYRTVVEHLLGITVRNEKLFLKPALPSGWDGYTADAEIFGSHWQITVSRGPVRQATLDGKAWDESEPFPPGEHTITLTVP